MSDWPVAGFTSTGSKRPEALFGPATPAAWHPPARMVSAAGLIPDASTWTTSWRWGRSRSATATRRLCAR